MNTTLKLIILLFVAVLGISCNTNSQSKFDSIKVIAPTEFKEKSINHTIIDIRTPKEFSEGHIEGAININYFDKTFLEQFSKYGKDEALFVYCKSGNRTSSASVKLAESGFQKIYDLDGGILNWTKNNYETVK
ncbi:MAG: rhodanese-like domain-containing protein [Lutibacter sp.]|jgi:rhodanese-related sulfurtransferase